MQAGLEPLDLFWRQRGVVQIAIQQSSFFKVFQEQLLAIALADCPALHRTVQGRELVAEPRET
jgi:hypothetical protein